MQMAMDEERQDIHASLFAGTDGTVSNDTFTSEAASRWVTTLVW